MKINELFLEITNQCQQNCIHCSTASDVDSKDMLSFQKIVDIIQQSVDLNNLKTYLTKQIIYNIVKNKGVYI